ncbi:DNA-binding NarL/FixJ family response regulator [Sphingobium jiangsuense]|uniref:DNA-binding NarL/FixJ family response regulator n=3 Tax=Sphingobium jiangsuense TaxID=870476 RepID=A0A7W6BJ67_9SPHN|nr:DNA-binding response regulator [Sphingobium jiangsuense]MBB3926031.1 DNA-binding NarL/FixJ family response regulator [Sphingobium jiangsuense]
MTASPPSDPRIIGDTVLIVDDTPDSLRFLTDTLEASGLTVLVATTGEGALDLLAHIEPNLILMDAVMPGMGGFEATRAIKANPAWAHIPVIFMTGLTESEHVVHGFDAGGADYVRKPIDVDELLARVRVHINHARARQASEAGLDATGRLLAAVDTRGALLWCTPLARQLILRHAPGWAESSGTLPPPFRALAARLTAAGAPLGTPARMDMGEGLSIELVLIARYRDNECLLRLNEINPAADIARLQERHGLTLREAEVLLWISYGKPNRVISEILAISPRTVNKHLEQIFEKLGVETRAAAAAVAVRTGSHYG